AVAPTTAMTRVPIPLVCPHPGGDVVTHLEGGGGVAQVRGEGTRGRRPGQHLPGGPAGHEELLVVAWIERGRRGGVGGGQGGRRLAVIAVGVRARGSRHAAGPAAGAVAHGEQRDPRRERGQLLPQAQAVGRGRAGG